MAEPRDKRRALIWLVSAFGALSVARYDAQLHPPSMPEAPEALAIVHARPEADALRDGRRIAINRARAEELTLLPGVGPRLAQRLVEARERGGPFRSPADLRRVKGVGERTAQKISQFLSFDVQARGTAREQNSK